MELGALVCGKKTRCGDCPLEPFCLARHLDVVRLRPVPGKKSVVTPLVTAVGVLRHEGRILLQKQPATGIWANLRVFPGGAVEEGEDPREALPRAFQRETGFAVRPVCRYGVIRHGYTTYRIAMHCFGLRLGSAAGEVTERQQDQDSRRTVSINASAQEAMPPPSSAPVRDHCWVTPEELAALPLPAPHRKLAERIAASDRGTPQG
jgi:A/G-specific adenine glycosylase